MILDFEQVFSDAQAVTAAAGSTHTLDMGVASRDIGTGENMYVVVVVQTALTDGGSNTSTAVALEGDSTTSFSPDGTRTLFSFPQAAAAGTIRIARLQPAGDPEQYQYLRLKYTPAGADLTGGKFTAFLTHDVQKYTSFADGILIS